MFKNTLRIVFSETYTSYGKLKVETSVWEMYRNKCVRYEYNLRRAESKKISYNGQICYITEY